jgi:hypothetical protein
MEGSHHLQKNDRRPLFLELSTVKGTLECLGWRKDRLHEAKGIERFNRSRDRGIEPRIVLGPPPVKKSETDPSRFEQEPFREQSERQILPCFA